MRRSALLLSLLLLAVAAAVAVAAAPTATTKPATAVGHTEATLNATVDPDGKATKVRFDVGTSTEYGLQSTEADVGSGTEPTDVSVPVKSLTPGTTYNFRVVATNEDGTTTGSNLTFKTATPPPAPRAPGVSILSADDVGGTVATLRGRVDPNGQPTTYHFDWGTSARYGNVTPSGDAGSRDSAVNVSARIEGLKPGTRYRYRLVASNATGLVRSADRTFTTPAFPTSATLAAERTRIPYGQSTVLTGKFAGPKVSGVAAVLQGQPFPFTAPFTEMFRVRSTNSGSYKFTIGSLTETQQVRVVAAGGATSKLLRLHSAARLGLDPVRRIGRSIRFAGRVVPITPDGRVSLQRKVGTRFVTVKRGRLRADGTFALSVRARRERSTYRVMANPNDGGRHVATPSAWRNVAGSKRFR